MDQYGNLIDRHNLWEMVGVRFRRALFPGYSDTVLYDISCPGSVSIPGVSTPEGEQPPETLMAETGAPGETEESVATRQIGLPKEAASGRYQVTAKLFYRKVDQFLLNFLLGEDSGVTAPVIEMTRTTVDVEVRPAGAPAVGAAP